MHTIRQARNGNGLNIALFHFHVTQIKRSAGQSAVASAAYRSGEKLHSECYGEDSDYTRKGGVIYRSEILLPPHAPPAYADRQTLWNAVEQAENEAGKPSLHTVLTLPCRTNCPWTRTSTLARQFLLEQLCKPGYGGGFLPFTQPDKEDGGISNPHFHVLCPIRPLLLDGKWGNKQRREYTGCTVNFKTYTNSIWNKKQRETPIEKQAVFYNTHSAIIEQEVFDKLHEIRKQRHRRTKTGKSSLFSGMVYCANCVAKVRSCTTNYFEKRQDHFVCASYRSNTGNCSAHFIRAVVLEELVWMHMKTVISYVTRHETHFRAVMEHRLQLSSEEAVRKHKMCLAPAERRFGAVHPAGT